MKVVVTFEFIDGEKHAFECGKHFNDIDELLAWVNDRAILTLREYGEHIKSLSYEILR